MSPELPRENLAASVQGRLLHRAKARGDDYQTLLVAYACERFLYRLGISSVRDRFVLKGAMLLRLWSDQPYRATRDLDLLRQGGGSSETIRADLEAVCVAEVEPDGLVFEPHSIQLEAISANSKYTGTRVTLLARSDRARITLQIDIGVGDAVFPLPQVRDYNTLLGFPAPQVLAYAPESVIAEKLEAILVLGDRNSRIKDYFDLRYLAERFEFDGATLAEAIRRTFARRGTPIPEDEPLGLTPAYWENPTRPTQVKAFARRAGLAVESNPGNEILGVLRPFLLPILDDLRSKKQTMRSWKPGGPWQ